MTTTTTDIPLTSLATWSGNVRQTIDPAKLDELKASILAHGLLQSLVVQPDLDGYEVVAGRRRLEALRLLAKDTLISWDFLVPCRVLEAGASAEEISLAENVVREPMHPADQFEAFEALVKKGATTSDISLRFGVTPGVVQQRLKLANVSPKIIAAYRASELTLEQVQAFAVSNDHKRQDKYLKDNRDTRYMLTESSIRRAMTEGEVRGSDCRALFIGLENYEQAGGTLHRDLFDDSADGAYLTDPQLLDTLVNAKLSAEADRLMQDGWSWAKFTVDVDYGELNKFSRRQPDKVKLDKIEETELTKLRKEAEEIEDKDSDDRTDLDEQRLALIEARTEELERKMDVWPDKVKASSGVIVHISESGRFDYEFGLYNAKAEQKSSDAARGKKTAPSAKSGPVTPEPPEPVATSQALSDELIGHKTAAIAASLMINPDVALASVVYTLLQDVLVRSQVSSLNIQSMPDALKRLPASITKDKTCHGYAEMLDHQRLIKDDLPRADAELFPWLLKQSQVELLRLLAFCAAATLSASARHDDHAGLIAQACKVDMAQWFTPTLDNYFSRLSKQQLLAHLQEVAGDHLDKSVEKMKQSDLAELAARDIPKARPNWLPLVLRIPQPLPAAAEKKTAAKKPAAKASKKKEGEVQS